MLIFEKNDNKEVESPVSYLSSPKISANLETVGFLLLLPLLLIFAFFAFRALPVIFFRRNSGDLFFSSNEHEKQKKVGNFLITSMIFSYIFF